MAIGLVFEQPVLAAIGCVVVNILLGLVFFFLTPLFLEPKDGKKYAPERTFAGNLNEAKKHFSRLGLGVFVILGLGSRVQILAMGVVDGVFPQWMENSWGMWLITFAPLYLIAVPVGLLLLRKVPVKPLEKHDLKLGRYIVSAIICIFMMYAGNILGTVITALLQLLPGISAGNTDLKKRLLAYAQKYPELCQLTEDDEQGGLRFEIDKHRIGIRLTAPYSSERRAAASQKAKEQQSW